VEGSCEHGNEPSGSIKCRECLGWRLLKKGSALWVSEWVSRWVIRVCQSARKQLQKRWTKFSWNLISGRIKMFPEFCLTRQTLSARARGTEPTGVEQVATGWDTTNSSCTIPHVPRSVTYSRHHPATTFSATPGSSPDTKTVVLRPRRTSNGAQQQVLPAPRGALPATVGMRSKFVCACRRAVLR
jgi:hypothetical protein